MPFKEDAGKQKTMTTKDELNRPVTVVSSASGNTEQLQDEIAGLGNVGDPFVEVGHPIADVAMDNTNEPSTDFVTTMQRGPINKMRVEDLNDFMRASVVARPVRLPSRLNARSKDPNWRLRWVEFKAEDGRRYNDCCSMGFRNAKKEEVVGLDPSVKIAPDGMIKSDDLILMIIQADLVDGYLKHNALESLRKVSKKGARQLAAREGQAIVNEGAIGENEHDMGKHYPAAAYRDKMKIFVPGDTDMPNH